MINTIALFIAWGLLVWGAYAISTLNKNFTSGSQLQAQDLQDMVNKLNEVTNKLNQVEGTANSAYSTAVNAQNSVNSKASMSDVLRLKVSIPDAYDRWCSRENSKWEICYSWKYSERTTTWSLYQ